MQTICVNFAKILSKFFKTSASAGFKARTKTFAHLCKFAQNGKFSINVCKKTGNVA